MLAAVVAAALAYPTEIAVQNIQTGEGASNRSTVFDIEMPGVPGALAFGGKEPDGLYQTYTLTVANRQPHNCECPASRPQWVASAAIGAALGKKYRRVIPKPDPVSCNLLMLGHGWTPTKLGLAIPPNTGTPKITVQTKRVADTTTGGTLRSTFTPTIADVAAMMVACPKTVDELETHCAQYRGPQCTAAPAALSCCVERFSEGDVSFPVPFLPLGTDGHSVPCTKIPGITLHCVPRPDLRQALVCPAVKTPGCAASAVGGAAGDGAGEGERILFTHRAPDGDPKWLPPSNPSNRVDETDYYCAIVAPQCAPAADTSAALGTVNANDLCTVAKTSTPTAVYFFETNEETPFIGMSPRGYPGTCLMPSLFVRGSVYPPSLVTLDNASANYCDNAFPAIPQSFGFNAARVGGLTFCGSDPLDYDERRELCRSGGTEVLVGFVMAPRTLDDACPPGTDTCLLIPGDPFATVQNLIDAAFDLTNVTVYLSPVPLAVFSMLVFEARALDLVRYSDPADPRNPFSNSSGTLLKQLNIGAADSAALFGPVCERTGFTADHLAALERIIERRRCVGPGAGPGDVKIAECTAAGRYVFMQTTSNATRFVELAEDQVYVPSAQPAADLTFSGTTITSAFKKRQTTVQFTSVLAGALCGQFLILGERCAVTNLRFNQSRCRGTGAQRVPVMFAGRSTAGSAVLGNTVLDAEGASAFLGGQIEQTRYINTNVLKTDRTVVGNTAYEYSDAYKGSRFVAAVFGSTLGSAILTDGVASPLDVDTRHAPQLRCFNASSGGIVCLRPGNEINLEGDVVQEMSICGNSCAASHGAFAIRASRRDGLGCFANAPITTCQLDKPTPGVRAVDTCQEGPFGPGDDGKVVDRYGRRCGWAFGNIARTPCSERVAVLDYTEGRTSECDEVTGAAELCDVLYDTETLRPCYHIPGDGVCAAWGGENSCNGFPVPLETPPLDANPCWVYNDTDIVLQPAASALRQQWFLTASGVVFSSRNRLRERGEAGCLGGCSMTVGCPPTQCFYPGPSFACFAVGTGQDDVGADFGCSAPARFEARAPRSDDRVPHTGVVRLAAVGSPERCITRTDPARPRARLVLAECAVDDPRQLWLLSAVVENGPVHISDPANAYDCPTVVADRTQTVYVAPCGPCSVAAHRARPDVPKDPAPFVAVPKLGPGVPAVRTFIDNGIRVYVGADAAVVLDVDDPSACRGSNGTRPCDTARWGPPASPGACTDFVGAGAAACAVGSGFGGLRAVECRVGPRGCVPGTHTVFGAACHTNASEHRVCRATAGTGATVECTPDRCRVLAPGQGYGYGGELVDAGNVAIGYSIVEAGIIQPYNASFSLTSFGPAVVNVSALTLLFGAAYEHRLFHRDVDTGVYIWLGVATLIVVAATGVVLWCTLVNFAEPKEKVE